MKFYFSTRQIPQLKDLSMPDRMAALRAAENKLTIPEKTLLNILKLLIIVPVFMFILRTGQDWRALLWAALFILAYPFLLKPLQHSLSAKYIKLKSDNNGE